jgi:hypothetical protein
VGISSTVALYSVTLPDVEVEVEVEVELVAIMTRSLRWREIYQMAL